MFSTCIFCNKSLGTNEVVESFPIGRRLAFDPSRGRLWVVCRKCERWNLTPLEERWEALEECERHFSGTRARVSTEHIGLARLPEGLELVRIGRPMRPEFAAWRYGDQFGRRRRRTILYTTGAAVALGGLIIGGVATGVLSGAFLGQSGNFVNIWVNGRVLAKVRTADGRVLKLKLPQLRTARLLPGESPDDWVVTLQPKKSLEVFEGEEARRIASIIVPRMNRGGGRSAQVQDAVKQIEQSGSPEAYLRSTIDRAATASPATLRGSGPLVRVTGLRAGVTPTFTKKDKTGAIAHLPVPTRLALEMALHEEQERRALEGELAVLEEAWRQAEEIASIADNLLVPDESRSFLDEKKSGDTPGVEA